MSAAVQGVHRPPPHMMGGDRGPNQLHFMRPPHLKHHQAKKAAEKAAEAHAKQQSKMEVEQELNKN